MFRLATNFDHWHSIYESTDCSQTFKAAASSAGGPGSFPSVTLATSPQGLGQRQFVVILVVDKLADLWPLEAVFRLRVGDELYNTFSPDVATRRNAVATLKEVAESVDKKFQAHREEPRGSSKWGIARVAGLVFAGLMIGAGMVAFFGGSGAYDSDLAEKLLAQVGRGVQESKDAATEATSAYEELLETRNAFREELTAAVDTAKKEVRGVVNAATAPTGPLAATLNDLKKDLGKVADQHVERAAQQAAKAKDELRALANKLMKLAETPPAPPPSTVSEPNDVASGTLTEADERNSKLTQAEKDKARLEEIQRHLELLDYQPGPIDGELGDLTKTAFLKWSKEKEICKHLVFESSLEDFIGCARNRIPTGSAEPPSAEYPYP